MAAPTRNRTKPTDPLYEKTRKKIQTSQLINRLSSNALGKLKKEMTPSQVRSAEILLAKTLPSLQSVELKGDEDNPLEIKYTKIILCGPDE